MDTPTLTLTLNQRCSNPHTGRLEASSFSQTVNNRELTNFSQELTEVHPVSHLLSETGHRAAGSLSSHRCAH